MNKSCAVCETLNPRRAFRCAVCDERLEDGTPASAALPATAEAGAPGGSVLSEASGRKTESRPLGELIGEYPWYGRIVIWPIVVVLLAVLLSLMAVWGVLGWLWRARWVILLLVFSFLVVLSGLAVLWESSVIYERSGVP
ncbi:hypothetical protein [Actinorugispora endophytica]|uniref:Uncharacterized protein n=1 Tax=Actinorugispora endophytica TaxID=1605990 RepID=A0A4R6V0V9_9ACTN|nr:hypothetical protein [Actinorugispora endophytica]TDQ53621.1 hypothetical protein EV190_10369 [Actinorugispora endophytica]